MIGDRRFTSSYPSHRRIDARLLEVLIKLGEVVDAPSSWTRGALARSLLGESVLPLSDRACSWSVIGAIAPALLDMLGPSSAQCDWDRLYELTVNALWTHLPEDQPRTPRKGSDIDAFNDFAGTHYEDVLDVIENAITSARAASEAQNRGMAAR